MRLLADECLDGRIIAWLRSQGQDIMTVRDACQGAPDQDVLALARQEDRLLVTEDKDFGELAVRARDPLPGIILLRHVGPDLSEVTNVLRTVMDIGEGELRAKLVVIAHGRIRVRQLGATP